MRSENGIGLRIVLALLAMAVPVMAGGMPPKPQPKAAPAAGL